ncbi:MULTISPECIES: hypothetical protein [Hymenobacter]|uniref:Uncharacterized protein n=1 Tax=Hymenobacter mucosus TaxID=1411120 RepID=A0A238Z3L6_9BACT|nr:MULTISPECIES: hypothetical protein [Hymenobacter]SNR78055.1 hypothetical protein SAMN06269173_106328 [Hymenobacter mucosus]
MKSLLKFFLLFSLVILGKVAKQQSFTVTTAKASRIGLQAPIRSASMLNSRLAAKSEVSGGGSYFWQTTAPVTNEHVSYE